MFLLKTMWREQKVYHKSLYNTSNIISAYNQTQKYIPKNVILFLQNILIINSEL